MRKQNTCLCGRVCGKLASRKFLLEVAVLDNIYMYIFMYICICVHIHVLHNVYTYTCVCLPNLLLHRAPSNAPFTSTEGHAGHG